MKLRIIILRILIFFKFFSNFSASNYWFYIPILAPHLGAILGSIIYEVLVSFHWPENDPITDLTLVIKYLLYNRLMKSLLSFI